MIKIVVIDTQKILVERYKRKCPHEINLTKIEYAILLLLANENWNGLYEINKFLKMMYDKNYILSAENIRVDISRLRKKGFKIETDYGRRRYRLNEIIWIK